MKKIITKITAALLVLVLCFSTAAPAATALEWDNGPSNLEEYREILESGGFPALTTKQFYDVFNTIEKVFRLLTGKGFTTGERFNFVMDEMLLEICGDVAEETGFDVALVGSNLPGINGLAEFVTGTFNVDTAVLREKIYELRYEQDAQGNWVMGGLYYFLGMYFSVIEECKAYCVPLEEENCYEVYLRITLKDGGVEEFGTGMLINTETETLYGRDGNGFLGIGFNLNYGELLVYTMVNVWMRDFGFMVFYDVFSYTTPIFFYNTRRIKFDYDGLEWMIQIWKGNYVVSNGAEVGIYTREPGSIGTYYDCANDEQMMNMSMKLYHGDELILERPEQLHWWLTGFKISDVLYPARNQTLDFTIEMKDEAMLEAFCEAIDNHYRHDMTYTVDGLKVNVIW
ncbi:MAG: DUF4474 domain-containing protein [Clostridia bacterium]|nr:DUF4474 domain-containing protein [Clostridia bacterium]